MKTYDTVLNFYVRRLGRVMFLTDAIAGKFDRLRVGKKSKTLPFGLSALPLSRSPRKNRLGFVGNLKP